MLVSVTGLCVSSQMMSAFLSVCPWGPTFLTAFVFDRFRTKFGSWIFTADENTVGETVLRGIRSVTQLHCELCDLCN
jgi:hypothetical protein